MQCSIYIRQAKNRYAICIRFSYNKQRLILTTGIYIKDKNNFDVSKEKILSAEENYKSYNAKLGMMINAVRNFLLSYKLSTLRKDDELEEKIIEIVKGKEVKKTKNFIYYLDKFVSLKSNEGTKTNYTTTRNKLLNYDPNCTFETMDREWLTKFENYMSKTMKINAYAIHLRNIRAIFNYALDEEITTLYPFRKFRIKKEVTPKRNITVEQLRLLRDYKVEPYQEKYRDMFMLMFYLIGINAADLFRLTTANVIGGRIVYHRAKTHKLYSIKIEPEAKTILDKYKGNKFLINPCDLYKDYRDFLHHMNDALKEIGPFEIKGRGGMKVRKPLFPDLSSYWARHTWATIAASLDIPKETISAALGHEIGSDVTSIYIEFDRKKIDEANRKIIDYTK